MKTEDYEKLWNNVIYRLHQYYLKTNYALREKSDSKQLIIKKYTDFRDYCKNSYMLDSNHFIDRHKVCACMIYAIVDAHSLDYTFGESQENDTESFPTFNEKVAITTGLSLLRAFIISSAKQNLVSDERDKIIAKFDSGIKLPQPPFINHGDYIENFAVELYFTYKKGNYNILSLAHTLYMLELYTRMQ